MQVSRPLEFEPMTQGAQHEESRLPIDEAILSGDNDSLLVDECRRGSLQAYERLYRLHGERLKRVAFSLLDNTADAEDAVQETFLKVHRTIGRFQGRSSLATWMHRILLNVCYDKRRSWKHRRPAALEEDQMERIPDRQTDHPLRLALERALRRLPRRLREVFVLFEAHGLSHREVAELLGISESSSKVSLFNAKRALREMLRESR